MNIIAGFVKHLSAPLIILLTTVGSTCGLILITRKKLKPLGPRNLYIYLFVIEYLNALFVLNIHFRYAYDMDLRLFTNFSCRFYTYIVSIYCPLPPMMLVYISIERLVSITYPNKRFILRRPRNQLVYLFMLAAFNLIIYTYSFHFIELFQLNKSNSTTMRCYFKDHKAETAFNYLDAVNSVLIPFVLMLIATTMLIIRIFQSRKRLSSSSRGNKSFRKDVRFSATSVLLNLVYIGLCAPFQIYIFLPDFYDNKQLFFALDYLYFLNYALDFYLIFATNSLVRNEFFQLVKCK